MWRGAPAKIELLVHRRDRELYDLNFRTWPIQGQAEPNVNDDNNPSLGSFRSHGVTCHPAEVTFPPLTPAEAGTRFSDPEGMQG